MFQESVHTAHRPLLAVHLKTMERTKHLQRSALVLDTCELIPNALAKASVTNRAPSRCRNSQAIWHPVPSRKCATAPKTNNRPPARFPKESLIVSDKSHYSRQVRQHIADTIADGRRMLTRWGSLPECPSHQLRRCKWCGRFWSVPTLPHTRLPIQHTRRYNTHPSVAPRAVSKMSSSSKRPTRSTSCAS